MKLIKNIKKFFKQSKSKRSLKGNSATRSKAKYVSMPRGVEFNFRNQNTKFYLRPRSLSDKIKWKKYPSPFVWDNPFPKGKDVAIRKFYADGEVMPFISGK